MPHITTLIVTNIEASEADIKTLLLDLPENSVHVSLLIAETTAALPIYAYGPPPFAAVTFPEEWQDECREVGKQLADKANEIEALLHAEGIEGDVSTAYCERSLLDDEVAARASLCDYVFLAQSASKETANFNQIMSGLLFNSPTGVILNASSIASVLSTKRPFIAWDRSLPATRAVHRALPLLKQAEEVTVAVFDPKTRAGDNYGDPGVDLAAWLSRHGCRVTVQQYPSGGVEIGTAINAKASELGADLVVMGAYAHSRARQMLLGGTTRTMIEQTKQAVLLAH